MLFINIKLLSIIVQFLQLAIMILVLTQLDLIKFTNNHIVKNS